MNTILRMTALVFAGGLLAACGDSDGGGGGGGGNGGGGGGQQTLQSDFGTEFASAFDAGEAGEDNQPGGVAGAVDTTAEPAAVAVGDIIPISFTDDPTDIPNP
jgi:hypothetical protein